MDLFPEETRELINNVVKAYVDELVQQTIDIPKIIVQPIGKINYGYHDFDLETHSINLQPIADDIIIHSL
jgi:type III restriction enzyme